LLALAVGVISWLDVDRPLTDVVARCQATLATGLLGWAEPGTRLIGDVISVPQGQVRVTKECTGLLVVGLVGAGMLAYPAGWRRRAIGIALLVPLVFTLDVVRVASLAFALRYGRGPFDVLHTVVWEGVFVLGLLAFWVRWSRA
jgi:exosortase/archaeosortase family protein